MKVVVLLFLWSAGVCLSAEPVTLPLDLGTFKTLDNKVYEETKVVGSDAVGIKIMHAGGTARISFDRLPLDLKAKFDVTPGAAAEQLKKEAADGAAHEKEMKLAEKEKPVAKPEKSDDKLQRLVDGDEDVSVWDIEIVPEPGVNTPASGRIATLEAYVARAQAQIASMEKAIVRMETSVSRSQAKAPVFGDDVSNNGTRTEFRQGRVARQQQKIAEVHQRMKAAEREIARLR